jgi:hypothetical protein
MPLVRLIRGYGVCLGNRDDREDCRRFLSDGICLGCDVWREIQADGVRDFSRARTPMPAEIKEEVPREESPEESRAPEDCRCLISPVFYPRVR